MLNTSVLITGSSRGLGLEMAKQLAAGGKKFKHKKIIATCRSDGSYAVTTSRPASAFLCMTRNPDEAQELRALSEKKPDLVVVKQLDVSKYGELPGFFKEIEVVDLLRPGENAATTLA